jgi:biopolymer transport protein ExbD
MVRFRAFHLVIVILAILAILAPLASAAEVNGKVVSVLEAKRDRFVIESGRRNLIFQLDRDGTVFINDKESKLGDLLPNDTVSVVYEEIGLRRLATEVRCLRK